MRYVIALLLFATVGREFLFAEQPKCDGKFRRLLTIQAHAAPCDLASFTAPPSSETVQISQPWVVRRFRGRFLNAEGVFPSKDFVFELHGPDGLSMCIPIARDGSFEAKKLRPGRYCFRTSSPSYAGWAGTVIIAEHAPAENTIELTLKLSL